MILSTQALTRRSRAVVKSSCPRATNALTRFQQTCTSDSPRLEELANNTAHFTKNSQTLMPTSWVKTAPLLVGMQRINLNDNNTMRSVRSLCQKKRIRPPKGFIKKNSFHYGKYDENELISFISLCVMNLNNTPGSVAVCIDIAVSTDTAHSMTVAIDSIKKVLRKRRNKCVIFAQVADTESARKFWWGKLTKSKRASVMPALFSSFDDRYLIYEDAFDMALFYE